MAAGREPGSDPSLPHGVTCCVAPCQPLYDVGEHGQVSQRELCDDDRVGPTSKPVISQTGAECTDHVLIELRTNDAPADIFSTGR